MTAEFLIRKAEELHIYIKILLTFLKETDDRRIMQKCEQNSAFIG